MVIEVNVWWVIIFSVVSMYFGFKIGCYFTEKIKEEL